MPQALCPRSAIGVAASAVSTTATATLFAGGHHMHRRYTTLKETPLLPLLRSSFQGPAVVAADAGQFFEAVTAHDAQRDMRFLLERVRASGAPDRITVKRTKNRQAYMGGRVRNPRHDQKTFLLDDISACVQGCILVN